MKNLKILGLFAMTATLASCGNDFLSVGSTDGVEASLFYSNEEEITQALVAAYAPLQWEPFADTYGPSHFIFDAMGDDQLVGGANAQDNEYIHRAHAFTMTDMLTPWGLWSHWYSGINRSTHVLEHVADVADISEAARTRIEAEAKFLRSYYYYMLWFAWGNVPYYEINLTPPFRAPQLKSDELYDTLVTTLEDEVIPNLPTNIAATETGRANKAAAQMLKARLVMYQNDESRFGSVLTDMKDIINSGQYSLKTTSTNGKPAFEALFMDEGEWCEESIWEINFVDGAVSRGWNSVRNNGGSVFPRLIGLDGLSGNDEFQGGWGFGPVPKTAYDQYAAGDTRADGGIIYFDKWATDYVASHPGAKKPTRGGRYQDTGYFIKKYNSRVGYNTVSSGDADMNHRNNFRVFRYAETLLVAAEMAVRTGTDAGLAAGWLQQVRDRAFDVAGGGTAPALTATVDNIVKERRMEFFGEGLRYFDLVRTGQAASVLGARGWTESKKYWPIPNGEMNSTADGTLVQNPY